MMTIFFDEHPMIIDRKLATVFGLTETIILQEIHYWIQKNEKDGRNYHEGYYWTYNSYTKWQKDFFPFWCESTIKHTILKLEKEGLLVSGSFDPNKYNHQKSYRINYDVFYEKIEEYCKEHGIEMTVFGKKQGNEGKIEDEGVKNTEEPVQKIPNQTYNTCNRTKQLKALNGFSSQKNVEIYTDFDQKILDRSIDKACRENEVEDVKERESIREIIYFFYREYFYSTGREHPRLNQKVMNKCVRKLIDGTDIICDGINMDGDGVEFYKAMIEKYFNTRFKNCNYALPHFMSDEIRNNRYYETMYTDYE